MAGVAAQVQFLGTSEGYRTERQFAHTLCHPAVLTRQSGNRNNAALTSVTENFPTNFMSSKIYPLGGFLQQKLDEEAEMGRMEVIKIVRRRYTIYFFPIGGEAIRLCPISMIGTQTTDRKTSTTIYFFPIGGEAIRPSQPFLIGRQTTNRDTSTTRYFFPIGEEHIFPKTEFAFERVKVFFE